MCLTEQAWPCLQQLKLYGMATTEEASPRQNRKEVRCIVERDSDNEESELLLSEGHTRGKEWMLNRRCNTEGNR